MRTRSQIILTVVNFVYVILGGVCFSYIERDNEKSVVDTTTSLYADFLDNNTCVTPDELLSLVRSLTDAFNSGVSLMPNATYNSDMWTIQGSIFFATTVVTTVGYGNMSPSTLGGQVVFIFYAIFGIPLMLVWLGEIGGGIKKVNNKMLACLPEKRFFNNSRLSRGLRTGFVLLIGCVLLVFLPGVVFHLVEDGWSYGTAIYYIVTTLSTVGFGDYVAGVEDGHWAYKLFVGVWVVFGLAWFAGLLSIVQEDLELSIDKREMKIVGSKVGQDDSRNGEGGITRAEVAET